MWFGREALASGDLSKSPDVHPAAHEDTEVWHSEENSVMEVEIRNHWQMAGIKTTVEDEERVSSREWAQGTVPPGKAMLTLSMSTERRLVHCHLFSSQCSVWKP